MKKILIIVLCLTSVLFICAWGEKKAELLDDRKLIDLDKAIEFAKPGADSIADTEGENEDDPISETEIQQQVPNEKSIIVISIRDESVTYNGVAYKKDIFSNIEDFENMLKRDNKGNVKFSLVDDFAEAHVYKQIFDVLKKLHSEIGLEFSYE